jgi:putative ABC transport system ATP-binding protein
MGAAPSVAATAALIAAEKVCHWYGRGALRKQVLFDVDLELAPGEIMILTGPSGSGKTTLLTLLGALRSTQEGRLRVLGRDLRGARASELVSLRRQIGYIFQHHNLVAALPAWQNVALAAALSGASPARCRTIAHETLEAVGLGEHAGKLPGELSGGQRQRVAVARALARRPPAWCWPTSRPPPRPPIGEGSGGPAAPTRARAGRPAR